MEIGQGRSSPWRQIRVPLQGPAQKPAQPAHPAPEPEQKPAQKPYLHTLVLNGYRWLSFTSGVTKPTPRWAMDKLTECNVGLRVLPQSSTGACQAKWGQPYRRWSRAVHGYVGERRRKKKQSTTASNTASTLFNQQHSTTNTLQPTLQLLVCTNYSRPGLL